MKRCLFSIFLFAISAAVIGAQEFVSIPRAWKWLSDKEVIFSYDGTYEDSTAFSINAANGRRSEGASAPQRYPDFPLRPEGAVNLTYSPDSTKLAFTRDNDLYVVDIADGKETRLTYDGSSVILNGYASWVYYEEILGRPSRYRAFWWSDDSRKIGFYRFDNSKVPMFPIYSAFADPESAASQSQSPLVTDLALGGSLSQTRYPKAGQTNPIVTIGIVDISDLAAPKTIWADFDPDSERYFGIPFWGRDSEEFFIAAMPRLQNTIDLYAVNAADGSKRHVYHETYSTWLNWFEGVVFTEKGLYMAREFETGWQQIYFLSYDGSQFRRLTDGTNWTVSILRVDEKKGDVYFTAKRDASVRQALYKVDSKGVIKALTDPAYNVSGVKFSPDGKYFAASYSNVTSPDRVAIFRTSESEISKGHCEAIEEANLRQPSDRSRLTGMVVADMKGPDYDDSKYALGSLVHITTKDGFTLPGMIVFPKDFDASVKYPVHVDIYGGPDSPTVRDRWVMPTADNQWYSDNGIIQIHIDPRAAGHNGRKGLDMIYRKLTVNELQDFCEWADYLKSLPYVNGDKIGVEGFSFGGTMTAMLLMQASDRFSYGIAGGGVYDWALYDSHYTERYMDTPQNNPEGYRVSRAVNYVEGYPVEYGGDVSDEKVMLKITHGTADDNVHHQNTLQLIDALQSKGKKFELMVYPDGMHGYRGYQGEHFRKANKEFWKRHLL